MKQIHDGDAPAADQVVLALTRKELGLLANALNEASEEIEEWEFETRLGSTPDEAEELRTAIVAVLRAE